MNRVKNKTVVSNTKIFGVTYVINIIYKYVKLPRLNIEGKTINIVLPNKYKKIENKEILDILLKKMYDSIAEKELETIMEKVRLTLKFAPEDYQITRIDKTLGKCYMNRIVINPDIVKYRKEIIEYVIFHEFCHLKFKRHNKKFYDMIEEYIPNHEYYAYEVAGMQY